MQIISLFIFAVLAAVTGLLPWWGVAIVAALIVTPTMRFQSLVGSFLVTKASGR